MARTPLVLLALVFLVALALAGGGFFDGHL
jgi:hypothetical protein